MEKELLLNIPVNQYPMLNRYPIDQVKEMVLELLEKQGETTETITTKKLGSAAAILESDLQHMFS